MNIGLDLFNLQDNDRFYNLSRARIANDLWCVLYDQLRDKLQPKLLANDLENEWLLSGFGEQ